MKIRYWIMNKLNIHSTPKATIQQLQEAADFVDFILLNLESGCNLEQSFIYTVAHFEPCLLKKKAEKMITFCSLGFSFGEAMNFALEQNDTELPFKYILENLVLSLKLGSPLIQILNYLSFHFRLQATSQLEELASEAPVKMIFPLVIFIFPVIFILLASGVIENLVHSFNF